jgi:orotidine-5'-phosphate decarboxylase
MTERTKFRELWRETVDKKNSVLCAGLDPAEFDMGRGEKGLAEDIVKGGWALGYVDSVAPYCAAIKPNIQYWKGEGDLKALARICRHAHGLGLVVIDDSKLADIGSTNDAGVFYANQRADAVTFSPFAGNMREAVKQAHDREIGLIPMCLMSNPEYEREKNKLVHIIDGTGYDVNDFIDANGEDHVKQYIQLAHDADEFKADGLVIGAPSPKNHITEEEIERVRGYVMKEMLVLLPGVGAQGGEADIIWKYFGRDSVIVNVGRSLMFPKGSSSTNRDHKETAKQYQGMLNKLRAA